MQVKNLSKVFKNYSTPALKKLKYCTKIFAQKCMFNFYLFDA